MMTRAARQPPRTLCCLLALLALCVFAFVVFFFASSPAAEVSKAFGAVGFLSVQSPTIDKTFEIRFKNIRQNYWMNFTAECPPSIKLLMLSMSRRDGFEKRKGIRQTWMKDALPNQQAIRFLIADKSEENEAQDLEKLLEQEQSEHGDLIFLHGFNDTYSHIHLKWFSGLQWQQAFCPRVEWVMKTDDDSVVHLRRLDHWIEHKFGKLVQQHPLLYIGHVFFGARPIRDKSSKWYISEAVYPLDRYPDFMQGTVYLTNPATISAILSKSAEIVGFYLDDVVFTGLLSELANVTRIDYKQHFLWATSYDEEHAICEGNPPIPTALSMWGADTVPAFEKHYGRLKAAKCKNSTK